MKWGGYLCEKCAHEMVDICVKYLQNMVRGTWDMEYIQAQNK